MGMFDFVKSIGDKVTGADKVAPEDLSAHIKSLGLPVEKFMASFNEDDSVDILGYVPDLETKEKVILAVGNVRGVGKVTSHLRIGATPAKKAAPAPAVEAPVAAEAPAAAEAPPVAEEAPAPITPEEDVEPTSTFYTVKSGDSLSKIAKAVYGDAGKYPVIFEANKPMLSDPNKIYPGQVLRIPAQ